jgi:hypothetical protein
MDVKVDLLLWQKISNENLRKQRVLEITQTKDKGNWRF